MDGWMTDEGNGWMDACIICPYLAHHPHHPTKYLAPPPSPPHKNENINIAVLCIYGLLRRSPYLIRPRFIVNAIRLSGLRITVGQPAVWIIQPAVWGSSNRFLNTNNHQKL